METRTPEQFKTIESTAAYAFENDYDATVFTDGAFRKNGALGGWAYVAIDNKYPDRRLIRKGSAAGVTSQIMELRAVMELVDSLVNRKLHILVLSDSTYVVKGVNQWRHEWAREGWTTSKWNSPERVPIANIEMWKKLHSDLFNADCIFTFKWVKGHDLCEGNILADQYATEAVEELKNRSTK